MTGQPDPTGHAAAADCTIRDRHVDDIRVLEVSGTVDTLTAPQLETAFHRNGRLPPAR